MNEFRSVPPVESQSSAEGHTLDEIGDRGVPTRDASRPDAQPSLPPEVVQQGERALLAASGEPSRKCEAPGCGRPLTGRAGKRAYSARCRAALSRQRQSEARAARARKIRSLLAAAERAAGDLRVRSLISKALRVLDGPRSRSTRQAEPRT